MKDRNEATEIVEQREENRFITIKQIIFWVLVVLIFGALIGFAVVGW